MSIIVTMKIGYARVSTQDQNLDLQRRALREAGCDEVYEDQGVSGAATQRDGLEKALAAVNEGDSFVVWKLDRLGRSLPHLVEVVASFGDRGIEFVSLTEGIDTKSAGGRLVFHMMAALADFERGLISERTKAGMDAAKASGRHVGRRPALTPEQVKHGKALVAEGKPMSQIARILKVGKSTAYKYLVD